MSKLQPRIDSLKNLEKELKEGDIERKINIFSYLQLLDYHIKLLEEVNDLADAIKNDDKEVLGKWIDKRVY